VVILDIRMPGKNGVELLRDIKQLKLSVVVIILPNYPYPGTVKYVWMLEPIIFSISQQDSKKSVRS